MIPCPSCGYEAPDDFAFCPRCATPLAGPPPIAEERRVVTSLFCDLVGSTTLGEDADPEDVDALLRRYNALARQVVESYGGVVEKYIGDAVVAVFGVSQVHEDDPERAVRAGLRLVTAVEELRPLAGHPIQVRVGINTGEALVRLDVTPGSGEGFLTGDAVNVGARLESAAPPMGVVVGDVTHRLTSGAILYEAMAPVVVKGKREPLEVWLAKEPLARTGAPTFDAATPFIGRSVELGLLTALLDKAADSCTPQIALIVGEPGIGKSRLVAEFFGRVDTGTRLVTWRQGRCLPYGEGVSFWALAEIAMEHAGICECDQRDTVEAKLEAVLPEGEDRPWFRQRLRALLGLEAAKAEREENFTAWLRFLEETAASGPAVIVLEDLHWADEAFLDFLEFFALRVTPVPLTVVATARPELFERRPSFGATLRVNRVALEPLSGDEIERLVGPLVEEFSADLRESIAKRAQGNPFFAEESARLLREDAERPGGSLLAGSVQAVIAARLDALSPALKAVLADAAVAGDVVWDGLLGAMGDRLPEEVAQALDELTAKQLICPVRSSSMADEREYTFRSVLSREVAYGQLPRRARAKRHATVAAWIDGKEGARGDKLAGLVAHHYSTALDLAMAVGDEALRLRLLDPTVAALCKSAQQVGNIDAAASERQLSRALDLLPARDSRRPTLEAEWAMAMQVVGDHLRASTALKKAATELRALGEVRPAAKTLAYLAYAYDTLGRDGFPCLRDALTLLEEDPPSEEMIFVLQNAAAGCGNRGKAREGLQHAERALAAAGALGLSPEHNDDVLAALLIRGTLRCQLGDATGLDDMRQAVEAALAEGSAIRLVNVYALATLDVLGPAPAIPLLERYGDLYHDRGLGTFEAATRGMLVDARRAAGQWDEALATVEGFRVELEAAGEVMMLLEMRTQAARVLTYRGEQEAAATMISGCLSAARRSQVPQRLADTLIAEAAVELDRDKAYSRRCLEEASSLLDSTFAFFSVLELPDVLRLMYVVTAEELAGELTRWIPTGLPTQRCVRAYADALLGEAQGELEAAAVGFAGVAASWHDFGMPYEEGQALLGRGRCLAALRRAPEAAPALEQARGIFLRLGAKPTLNEVEGLLAQLAASAY